MAPRFRRYSVPLTNSTLRDTRDDGDFFSGLAVALFLSFCLYASIVLLWGAF